MRYDVKTQKEFDQAFDEAVDQDRICWIKEDGSVIRRLYVHKLWTGEKIVSDRQQLKRVNLLLPDL